MQDRTRTDISPSFMRIKKLRNCRNKNELAGKKLINESAARTLFFHWRFISFSDALRPTPLRQSINSWIIVL